MNDELKPRVKKLNGEYFQTRGSNKKYPQLNDLDNLFEMCKKATCPADVAKELKVPRNCVQYMIDNHMTLEQQAQIPYRRQRHSNQKRIKGV